MHTPRSSLFLIFGLTVVVATGLALHGAQDAKAPAAAKEKKAVVFDKPQAPATLPGKGLLERDFLLVAHLAARDDKGIQIVKGGKVVWRYSDPTAQGPYSDATLLPNGNILFAHGFGVQIVTPDKKVVWRRTVKPEEHEIHGVQPIGKSRVIFLQSGQPTGSIVIANINTGEIEQEITVPLSESANLQAPRYVHMQMRRMRLTPRGTVLLAYTNANEVVEINEYGRKVWSAKVPSPWSVERLKNGNTLVNTMRTEVLELDPKGEIVWKFTRADAEAQGYVIDKSHVASRLPNGNTLITVNNETAWRPGMTPDEWAPVQAIEVSPDKKIVWALRSWTGDTNLGPATTIQFLDDPNIHKLFGFGTLH
jgi:hypothetical protein